MRNRSFATEYLERARMEVSPPTTPSEPPSVSGMNSDEYSISNKLDPSEDINWEALHALNGRSAFQIIHDIRSCFRCWSWSSYYQIIGDDGELLLNAKKLFSLPGCKPSNVYVKDSNKSTAFYIKFITFGCFPVLKRIEIRNDDDSKKRIGVIAAVSKILSTASYRISNELEGTSFRVHPKINLIKGHDYEIITDDGNSLMATVDRKGPSHKLQIKDDNVVTGCNKALFISFCIFLDVRRRYVTA